MELCSSFGKQRGEYSKPTSVDKRIFVNIPYVHGGVRISYMHFSFAWSANLGHASWHLKETMART